MDTAALAAAFPFTSPDLPRDPADPDPLPGILYGANTAGPGLVAWDRWAQDNHNSVTLAASGAGKSYLAKLGDPAQRLPGHRVLGHRPRRRIRPPRRRHRRRLPPPRRRRGAAQPLRPARAATGRPAAGGRADPPRPVRAHRHRGAARRAARPGGAGRAGPGDHGRLPRTPGSPPTRAPGRGPPRCCPPWPPRCAPTQTEAAVALADRLVPFTEGTHSGLFAGPTTTRPAGHLVVFSLRDVPDELKAVATLLALDTVWRQVSDPAAPPAAPRHRG